MSVVDIVAQIPEKFEKAKASGDLFFFPSTVVVHREPEVDIDFQITICPALLQKKPQLPISPQQSNPAADTGTKDKKTLDPFAPPYNKHLFVSELKDEDSGEEYVVLLNKYSVLPHHFLLVSKEYKSQTSPLLPPDLVQAYKILVAASKSGTKYFAFYNCGDLSGASQPHKHVQFLPIDESENRPPIEKVARSTSLESPSKPFAINQLPYANHIFRLPTDLQSANDETLEKVLADTFLSLLDLGISTIRHDPDYPAGKPSYNIIITLEHIHLIPRRHEKYTLETGDDISVNSLGFAGMLLVRGEDELENVKKEGVGKILRGVALESVHEVQVAGTTDEAVPSHM